MPDYVSHTQRVPAGELHSTRLWPDINAGSGDLLGLTDLAVANVRPERVRFVLHGVGRLGTEFLMPPELRLDMRPHGVIGTASSPVRVDCYNLSALPLVWVAQFEGGVAARAEEETRRRVTDEDDYLLGGNAATMNGSKEGYPAGRGGLRVWGTQGAGTSAGQDFQLLPDDRSGLTFVPTPYPENSDKAGLVSGWTVTLVGPSPARLRFTHNRGAVVQHNLLQQQGDTTASWPIAATQLEVFRARAGNDFVSAAATSVQVVALA